MKAGPALQRMREILSAPSPYGLIHETEGLISSVAAVNDGLIAARRHTALATIDDLIEQVRSEVGAAGGDASLQASCLGPLETLRTQVEWQESVAHIAQAEQQAQGAFDTALAKIERNAQTDWSPTDTGWRRHARSAQTDHQGSPRRRTGQAGAENLPGNPGRRECLPRSAPYGNGRRHPQRGTDSGPVE
jgi:hypothetical protein